MGNGEGVLENQIKHHHKFYGRIDPFCETKGAYLGREHLNNLSWIKGLKRYNNQIWYVDLVLNTTTNCKKTLLEKSGKFGYGLT